MTRNLWPVVFAVLLVAVLSVALGTMTSTRSSQTPYFSALSNFAVAPAEACPACNAKTCSQGVCVAQPPEWEEPHKCCIELGQCRSGLCNP